MSASGIAAVAGTMTAINAPAAPPEPPASPEAPRHGARLFGLVVKLTPERRREVYAEVEELSTPTRTFYLMVAISTTIASYGLLANSTAVVIGAMLVAPLMGPILGTALGLATGDRKLFAKSASALLFGALLAVFLGLLIGLVPLRLGFGSEVVARTRPTLYDIVIALASALAGAYAVVDPRLGTALPGVAIATALVPPLATCGLCLAEERWTWALGAFLLFFANLLAIQVAVALIFTLFGMAEVQTHGSLTAAQWLRRFAPSLVLLAGVSVFMTVTLVQIVRENSLASAVETSLRRALRARTGAQLSDLRIERPRPGARDVIATVLSPQDFDPGQVAGLEQTLQRAVRPDVHLVIRTLISRDMDRSGPVFLADDERERRNEVAQQTEFLRQSSQALKEALAAVPGAELVEVNRQIGENDAMTVTAVVRTPTAIDPDTVATLEAALTQATGTPVRLILRSILTRDADAHQFLYEKKTVEAPPAPDDLAFRHRLEHALQHQMGERIPGARLAECRFRERDARLLVLAVAQTPRTFAPSDVRTIEAALRRYVHPRTDLIVRSRVGSDAAAVGYLASLDESAFTESDAPKAP